MTCEGFKYEYIFSPLIPSYFLVPFCQSLFFALLFDVAFILGA